MNDAVSAVWNAYQLAARHTALKSIERSVSAKPSFPAAQQQQAYIPKL
jgi:hypothetical protein